MLDNTTDSHILKLIVTQLLRTDCNHCEVFESLGISKYLDEPVQIEQRITIAWLKDFINNVDSLVRDSLFFIKAGNNAHPADYGDLGLLAMVCETYGDAVYYSSKYQRVLKSNLHHHFFVDDHQLISRINSDKFGDDFAAHKINEIELAGIFAISQFVTATAYPVNPTRVEFKHRPKTSNIKYIEILGGDVVFGSEFNQIVSLPIVLETKVYASDPELFSLINRRILNTIKNQRAKTNSSEQIREYIQNCPDLCNFGLQEAAEHLDISGSTLKRQLAMEGTTFSEIMETAKYEKAKQLLSEHALSVEEIGKRLGFSSASSFSRAFKVWATVTPAKYRTLKVL